MKKFIVSILALVCAASLSQAQQLQQLPNDPAVRTGKLDNGLTYYIRHNELPAQRAEFWLCTDAGAIQEELPNQDGLAHFLEHMCFNGTKNFPGKGILNYLESIGASFGGNVNASTGVEHTIYLLNNIPLVNDTVVDSCILIMHDYSHFVLCEPEEIDAERGVIIEEKRTRNTASWRNNEKYFDALFKGTKYADGLRMLIGSEENLRNFKPEDLTSFYHKWYTPNNQALIVVGDINVDEVEAKIQKIFADIPAEENPAQKENIVIPVNEEPIIAIITDPENTNNSFQVMWKSEERPTMFNSTPVGLMTDLVQDIASRIMNERLQEVASDPACPFIQSSFGIGNLIKGVDAVQTGTVGKDGRDLEAFEAALIEYERMHRYGFTDSEIDRAKTEIISLYERAANQAATRKNSELVNPLINHFYKNYSYMDPAVELQLVQALMPQLQPAIINQAAQSLITKENMAVLYFGKEGEGIAVPTAEEIQAVITKVQNAEIAAPAGEEIPEAFLDPAVLKGSKIKSTKAGIYGSTEYVLANGMKVILLPTDYEKDQITFTIAKRGGRSLIEDSELNAMDENLIQLYVGNTGISQFSNSTMNKMLSGKQLGVNAFVQKYNHGIAGTSTVKDFETALQLAYLSFADPRFDEAEWNKGVDQVKTVLPALMEQSNYKLQKEMYDKVYDGDRTRMIDEATLAGADLKVFENCMRRLFADAAGATAVIVGDFKIDEALPLVQKYLGSIAKGKKATAVINRNDRYTASTLVDDFKAKMQTPKVTCVKLYRTETPYTGANDVAADALSYILDMAYVETLREQEGGTYGASTNTKGIPEEGCYILQVDFDTNVDQADKLREIAQNTLVDMAANGPTAEQFDKTVKNLEKNIPEAKLRNNYWKSEIFKKAFYDIDHMAEYEAAVKNLTPDDVKEFAAKFLAGNSVELVMRPLE